jgi:hypothetical protein
MDALISCTAISGIKQPQLSIVNQEVMGEVLMRNAEKIVID